MENILMGLVTQPAQTCDPAVTTETTNLLFAVDGVGGDLVARNIQRGRDHAIRGFCCYYQKYQNPFHDCRDGWDVK